MKKLRMVLFAALLVLTPAVAVTPALADEEEIPVQQIICTPQDGMLYCWNPVTGETYPPIPDPDWVPPDPPPGGGGSQ